MSKPITDLTLKPGDACALAFCIRRELARLVLPANAPVEPKSHADENDFDHIKRIRRIYDSLPFT